MDLRVENPKTSDAFVAALAAANVKLPIECSDHDVGVILDADGNQVLTVDQDNLRPNDEVEMICACIVVAVNTCGSFKAVRKEAAEDL